MTKNATLTVQDIDPIYGVNYKRGYIGFVYYADHIVSRGIAYFTRWARIEDVKVSHCFIVACKNDVIEALLRPGVVVDRIGKYFEDPTCQVFFRKPRGWTPALADAIIATAARQVGEKYDLALIIAQAMQGLYLGRVINRLFRGRPDEFVSRLIDNPAKWICSELVSYCLDEQPELRDRGILAKPVNTIDPQELFVDAEVFEPWQHSAPDGAQA